MIKKTLLSTVLLASALSCAHAGKMRDTLAPDGQPMDPRGASVMVRSRFTNFSAWTQEIGEWIANEPAKVHQIMPLFQHLHAKKAQWGRMIPMVEQLEGGSLPGDDKAQLQQKLLGEGRSSERNKGIVNYEDREALYKGWFRLVTGAPQRQILQRSVVPGLMDPVLALASISPSNSQLVTGLKTFVAQFQSKGNPIKLESLEEYLKRKIAVAGGRALDPDWEAKAPAEEPGDVDVNADPVAQLPAVPLEAIQPPAPQGNQNKGKNKKK